jgi:hypothetical protein
MKDENAVRGRASIELILTNLNLVVINKRTLGKSRGIETFPLNQIKVHNGQAQALMGGTSGYQSLEVYFLHGQEEFRFIKGGKKTIQTWIGKINEAVTGQPAAENGSSGSPGIDLVADALSSVPGGDRVAGVLKGTLGAFNSKRGAKPEAVVQIATKCVSCGAAVSGVQRQTVTCSYCLSAQQL